MEKYDGWVVKVQFTGKPYFLTWHFRERRTDVVKAFNDGTGGLWRKYRQIGTHKLVKVKLVEVK
ncbi:unnamed protein product [marine sediment metagenome]|uniref:Uncharacterized protein n=1 Tax=marine sediment metagenome TaxID=412755 RepID=X1D7R2_9ZZZZ